MAYVTKYGCRFDASRDPLEWEFDCIRQGGKWKHPKTGEECGDGLFNHLMTARKLIWPHRYRHRWTDLMYENFIENDVTVLMGCGSSGKTSCAAEYALVRYWSSPDDTLVILSTTTLQKLQMAIFGEIKMLWEEGKSRYEWLAGNPIEYKHAISTDNIEDGALRDLRKGIVGIACYQGRQFVGLGCFVSGTLVDTPTGQVCIETLNQGDEVVGAFGTQKIKRCSVRTAEKLVRVHFKDGSHVDCTPEHPFFTSLGWKSAVDLDTESYVLSAHETLRILSKAANRRSPQDQILFRILQGESEREAVHCLRKEVRSGRRKNHNLQQGVSETVAQRKSSDRAAFRQTVPALRKDDEERTFQPQILQRGMRVGQLRQDLSLVQETVHSKRCQKRVLFQALHDETSNVGPCIQGTDAEEYGSSGTGKGHPTILAHSSRGYRETTQTDESHVPEANGNTAQDGIGKFSRRSRNDSCRESSERVVSGGEYQSQDRHRAIRKTGSDSPVSNRLGLDCLEIGGGTGRFLSQHNGPEKEGFDQRQISSGQWVDCIEILEQTSDPRYNQDQGGYRVYNLEVAGHPSYSVNGVLVHNSYAGIKQRNIIFIADELQFCPPTFLACLPNMFQNPNVKVIGSGNPKHDAYDQLGQAAEPIEGWSSLGEITKTTRWPIKFHKGYCINLVGTDSPNFDVPEDAPIPFPRLINRNTIARVEARWPKGSLEWCKQCSGVMQIGLVGNRVITRQICDAHHAFDLAVWKDEHRTRIGYLDPAWGGINADRCVWGWLEFGEDSNGVHIIRLNEPIVIPVMAGTAVPPEDQIALAVHQESKRLNIPTENIFYDSTGKGTLGYAFARVFGNSTPVPIAFDGKASTRPVRHDLFIIDRAKNVRRLKTCYEHYSKFVTELWFSVRYVVECDQMREMPESALSEFCMREYYEVSGDRIEVEPKDDTRERMGESPDLADAIAVGVEGARQRGFKIKRLGASSQDDGNNGFQWLADRVRKHESFVRSKQLEYA